VIDAGPAGAAEVENAKLPDVTVVPPELDDETSKS
jgi:hypothetical protein